MKTVIPKETREAQLTELCAGSCYSFIGWIEGYTGKDSKAEFNCTHHGNWAATIHSFINGGKRCKECGTARSATGKRARPEEIEARITNALSGTKFSFIRFEGAYVNLFTKAVLFCPEHGNWAPSVGNILNAKSKCPGCCKTGFSNGRPGVLYALRSDCGQYVKIGITNNLPSRLRVLRRKTPFGFLVIETVRHTDGKLIRALERHMHLTHQSAGLSGFDGATEWLIFTPEVQDDLRDIIKRFGDKKHV